MHIKIVNEYHAGDVILSRPIIRRIRELIGKQVMLSLKCQPRYYYLWQDLGLPINNDGAAHEINIWFAYDGIKHSRSLTLTYSMQVFLYNLQIEALGLPLLEQEEGLSPPIDFPSVVVDDAPGILVENGPVASGQDCVELNPFLERLAYAFPNVPFYCNATPPANAPNLIDFSSRDLIKLSSLSNVCLGMISRLSGVFCASLTSQNMARRLKRFVLGKPFPFPIWDSRDVVYLSSYEALEQCLADVVKAA